jgi:histone H2B
MDIMANFTADMFSKLASRAGQLVRDVSKRKTLTAREVQTAVRLEIRGDLSEHAVIEGSKAVTRYFHQMKS